jgi:hypothetical protein
MGREQKKIKEIEDIEFGMIYKPLDYMICLEAKTDELKDTTYQTKMSELRDMEYLDLTIASVSRKFELMRYNIVSPKEFDQRIRYYSFEMQKDIKMIVGIDTIPCALYHFERAIDIQSEDHFILGFPKSKSVSDRTIVLQDKIFGKGIVKFNFSAQTITNLPKVKTI